MKLFSKYDFKYSIKRCFNQLLYQRWKFYYVINYDDVSGSTSSVTSGSKTGERVINIFKDETFAIRSKKIQKNNRGS